MNHNSIFSGNYSPPPTMAFSFWKQPVKESFKRTLTVVTVFKIFEYSVLISKMTPSLGAIGIALSIVPLIIARKQIAASKEDFFKMDLTTKIVVTALPIILGLVIPMGLNSLSPTLKLIEHVNLVGISLSMHVALVPIFKHLQKEIRGYILGQDHAFQQMKYSRDSWREVALSLILMRSYFANSNNNSFPSAANQHYHSYETINSDGMPIIIEEVVD